MAGMMLDPDPIPARAATALVTGDRGRPRSLRWRSRTYRVTDAPTPLEEALDCMLTHPLPVHGWRFQGTSVDDGETLVFDVLASGGDWHVVKTYH